MYTGWVIKRLALGLFDVLAVNVSYALALVLRFYIGDHYLASASPYFDAFAQFAPWYSAISIVIFIAFKLYSSRWKYAGISDLNRLFFANVSTVVVQIVGTILFVKRMPLTYYFIGATIQFFLIAASRFAYRIFMIESTRFIRSKHAQLNVMIVGTGETSRIVRKQIEHSSNNVAHPVCIFSYRDNDTDGYMDGVPFVSGMQKLKSSIEKYKVECVIMADSIIPDETRKQIKDICQKINVEVQDFSGYLRSDGNNLTLQRILECVNSPVDIMTDDGRKSFASGEEALMSMRDKYIVKQVFAKNDRIIIDLSKHKIILNDLNQEWVQIVEKETGSEISFF